jgi:hypothetical protein
MSTPTPNITTEPVKAVTSSPTPEAPTSTPPTVQTPTVLHQVERVPSNWEIVPLGGDTINARHSSTGRVFEGTIQEFNTLLKS